MPKVTIDNKLVDVPNGTLVVEAAKKVGNEIPVFCYHPKLLPVGMCRMCLVEVGTPKMDPATKKPVTDEQGNVVMAWIPKLQTGCTTVVSEGMSVRTNSPAVADARRSVVEFLLTSHPLDCPICDKGGECPLQNLTMAYGPGQSRFPADSKFHNEKRVPLGDLIMLDRERCIQCSRCIRFQDEIADDHVLGFQARGRGMEIVSLSEPGFDSKFSGNTIDICPVGALTSRDFRLSARVWEVHDTPSVCAHCSAGCNLMLGERDHQIKRVVPRENEAVNEIWVCDKGRFAHHFTFSPDRLTQPLVRKNGDPSTGSGQVLQPATWDEALNLIVSKFAETKKQHGADALGGLGGDRAANEDLYLFQKFFRRVIGSPNLEHRVGWSASNVGGELVKMYGAGVETNLGALDKNVVVLVLGADPEEEQPVIRLRLAKSARRYGASLIVANGRVTKIAQYAKQALVYQSGAESAFVLGMVRTILDEGLENSAFVSARVTQLDAFKHSLEPFTVEHCAEVCHVQADKIREAARAFAKSPDALILYGREAMFAQQHDPAVTSSIEALLLLTGHVGRKNNGLIALYPHNNSTGALDFGLLPTHSAGRVKTEVRGLSVRDMTAGKVRALYAMACDPAADAVGGFTKPEFLVVQDLFLTETAKLADVVLPAQSFAERDGTFTNTERRIQLFRAAVKPVGASKPDWAILTEIARRLGADWGYKNSEQIMDEITTQVPLYAGMTYAALAQNIKMPRAAYGQGNPSDQSTEIAMGELENISSGKAWLSMAESDTEGKFDLYWNEPSKKSTVDGKESPRDASRYFLAVERSLYDRGTMVSKTKITQPRVPKANIEINSLDAEELSIADGVRVRLSFDSRVIELSARVDGRVPPGTVLVANNLDGTNALPMGAHVKVEKI